MKCFHDLLWSSFSDPLLDCLQSTWSLIPLPLPFKASLFGERQLSKCCFQLKLIMKCWWMINFGWKRKRIGPLMFYFRIGSSPEIKTWDLKLFKFSSFSLLAWKLLHLIKLLRTFLQCLEQIDKSRSFFVRLQWQGGAGKKVIKPIRKCRPGYVY